MTLRSAAGMARLDGIGITLAAIAALFASACGAGGKTGDNSQQPPPPSAFTISGAVTGASSVTVTLSAAGAADRTTTTGANGSYAFADVANGTYTVKPAKAGFTVAPLTRVVTVAGADVGGVSFARHRHLPGPPEPVRAVRRRSGRREGTSPRAADREPAGHPEHVHARRSPGDVPAPGAGRSRRRRLPAAR
jgi:hypothetical protein